MLTLAEREALMLASKPKPEIHYGSKFGINWNWDGCGFGQTYFRCDNHGKMVLIVERMSKESVRKILYAMVDEIIENSEFQ